jgi:hypothetical protein
MTLSPFADLVSRLGLTPAGIVRNVADDPQKAAENLRKYQLDNACPSAEADQRKKITPEQALREAMFDGYKLAELLTGEESPRNSEVWRVAANKSLSYRYMHNTFRVGFLQYWTRRAAAFIVVLMT